MEFSTFTEWPKQKDTIYEITEKTLNPEYGEREDITKQKSIRYEMCNIPSSLFSTRIEKDN